MERPFKLSADDHPVIIIAEPRFRVLNGLFAAPRIIKIKTGFQVKAKPLNQLEYSGQRYGNKRLQFPCTVKGNKEGSTNANFVISISYFKGVVILIS